MRLVLFGLVILVGPVLAPQGLITPALLERLGSRGGIGHRGDKGRPHESLEEPS